eukprot:TRINITY_DN1701_c0_g1_i5.p2 TRINITY_DN1701_c0_g1~~TRINITY_DN1701_c0_g1_i5.p2  ORF type:complete len:128 (-),score=34.12 TRINITY_DN1701_c0_g1_i5:466-849(-)
MCIRDRYQRRVHGEKLQKMQRTKANERIIEEKMQSLLKELKLPPEYPDYSTAEYWNRRYFDQSDAAYEWYVNYEELRLIIRRTLTMEDPEILNVGCGNSGFFFLFSNTTNRLQRFTLCRWLCQHYKH